MSRGKDKSRTMVQVEGAMLARLDRLLEEMNRRAREGEGTGGIPAPTVTRTALFHALLEPGLAQWEKRYKLPKMEGEDGDGG